MVVPVLHKRVTKATYSYIIESMRARLLGWAARTLSLAGQITLAKAVLHAIHVHAMQSSWLPKGTCEVIENIIRKFFLGNKDGKVGMATAAWKFMQLPVDNGGLGFKDVHQDNQAFLIKIGFQLILEGEELWNWVLRVKYKMDELVPLSLAHSSCLRLWRGLGTIWEELKESVSWVDRDGSQTDFWYDNWLNSNGYLAFSYNLGTNPRPTMVPDSLLARVSGIKIDWRINCQDRCWRNLLQLRRQGLSMGLMYRNGGRDRPLDSKRCCLLLDLSCVMRESILDKSDRLIEEFNQILCHNKVSRVRPTRSEVFWNGPVQEWVKAVYDGLSHAWAAGFRRVEVETDNKEVACIVNRSSTLLTNSTLVHAIWSLLNQDWPVQVWHVSREVNEAADKLVVMGRGQSREWRVFNVPLGTVTTLLDEEQGR
ncbi:hypothetical protein GQ457_10G013130 [Hibiscus cannabinus]